MAPNPTNDLLTSLLSSSRCDHDPAAVLESVLDALPNPVVVVELDAAGLRLTHANGRALGILAGASERGKRWRSPDELAATLRARLVPLESMSPDVGRFVILGSGTSSEERLDVATARWKLTRRQREVLAQLADGECNKGIAATLDIAEGTVELHMTAMLRKAGVTSRAALLAAFWTLA